jgi:hypothetical protein
MCDLCEKLKRRHLTTGNAAIRNGHYECLKGAIKDGEVLNEISCENAVIGNHLDLLKILVENNVPYGKSVLNCAVFYGRIEHVKYLVEMNTSMDETSSGLAARANQPKILEYLLENNCPFNLKSSQEAMANGSIACLTLFIKHGLSIDSNFLSALSRVNSSSFSSDLNIEWTSYSKYLKNISVC